ncbi:XRE family transcriptional regulator [Streptococcus sp. NLN64]|uniref:XRE family transcriptional regulator n=1 Tax=Streptococcus sp. NLN64 TaxID=2822799 RepID=UPI0018C9F231|nr:XRE family transcriptional regulator [Streptococcus sp. NLN64]MBG9366507.1 LexA family transcriptional regulator [Streptococcus sp. NLN64]
MHLGEIIKEYRIGHKLSMDAFAKKSGLTKGYISMLEKNEHPKSKKPIVPTEETISKVARGMGVDVGYILNKLNPNQEIQINISPAALSSVSQDSTPPLPDSVSKLNQELNQKNHIKWVDYGNDLLDKQSDVSEESTEYNSDKITKLHKPEEEYEYLVVHGLESAGDGIWQEDDADIEVRIPKDKIPEQFDDLAMVIGDSMRPRLHNGDILFITFTKQIENGEIGVFRTSKGNFVKRLQTDRLESLNPDYDDVYFTEDEFAEVVGVVVDVYRK